MCFMADRLKNKDCSVCLINLGDMSVSKSVFFILKISIIMQAAIAST